MEGLLHLEIVTPDKSVVNTHADYIGAPSLNGTIGILPKHISLLSALDIGELYYRAENKTYYAFIAGGFIEVDNNKVTILSEAAELCDQIDVSRAEKAFNRAKKRLEDAKSGQADIDLARAELALNKAINRLNLSKLR